MKDELGEPTPVTRLQLKRVELYELVMSDDLLRTAPLVKELGAKGAKSALGQAIARRYPDKVMIFEEGEPGESLYLVLRGEVRLYAREGGDTIELGVASKGDVFGEAELLDGGAPRASWALAAGEVDVAELPAHVLATEASGRPGVMGHLRSIRDRRRAALDELSNFLKRW